MTTETILIPQTAPVDAPDTLAETQGPKVSVSEEIKALIPGQLSQVGQGSDSSSVTKTSIHAELMDDCVQIDINGTKKFLSYTVFSELVAKHANILRSQSNEGVSGFNVPKGCSWVGVSQDGLQINFYYPECVREILYHDTKMTIVVPNIIIYHKLTRQTDTEYAIEVTRYFCTDRAGKFSPKHLVNAIDHSQGIYLLPFSNTYESGNMCYGYNTMPNRVSCSNLSTLDWFYEFLFSTPFNDDLGIKAVGSIAVRTWYSRLSTAAKEGKGFPYSNLRGHAQFQASEAEGDEDDEFTEEVTEEGV